MPVLGTFRQRDVLRTDANHQFSPVVTGCLNGYPAAAAQGPSSAPLSMTACPATIVQSMKFIPASRRTRDEQRLRRFVHHMRRVVLLDLPAAHHGTRVASVIASIWSCVTKIIVCRARCAAA
jgi:hypothetical protein